MWKNKKLRKRIQTVNIKKDTKGTQNEKNFSSKINIDIMWSISNFAIISHFTRKKGREWVGNEGKRNFFSDSKWNVFHNIILEREVKVEKKVLKWENSIWIQN
jgi:hypothetical protein